MTARLSLFGNPDATATKAVGHFGAASKTILQESALPAVTQKLVVLRASQVNGDAYATRGSRPPSITTKTSCVTWWCSSR